MAASQRRYVGEDAAEKRDTVVSHEKETSGHQRLSVVICKVGGRRRLCRSSPRTATMGANGRNPRARLAIARNEQVIVQWTVQVPAAGDDCLHRPCGLRRSRSPSSSGCFNRHLRSAWPYHISGVTDSEFADCPITSQLALGLIRIHASVPPSRSTTVGLMPDRGQTMIRSAAVDHSRIVVRNKICVTCRNAIGHGDEHANHYE